LFVEVNEIRTKLMELGCFRNVQVFVDVSQGPSSTADGVEVTYYVKELSRAVGGVNTQIGNNEGSVGVGMQMPNLLGRGENFRINYNYGSKKTAAFFADVTKPMVHYGGGARLAATLFTNQSESAFSGFRLISRGTNVNLALNPDSEGVSCLQFILQLTVTHFKIESSEPVSYFGFVIQPLIDQSPASIYASLVSIIGQVLIFFST
jgi:outer membrane protein assembly factor BamA